MKRPDSRCLVLLLLLASLSSCSQPPTTAPQNVVEEPSARLQAIPEANPEKYRHVHEMKDWRNPTLIVREDAIGLLDLANHEIHILKPEEVPAALANLPPEAWPYGRVVAVQLKTVGGATEEGKTRLRQNRALLIGTLETLKVAINEIPPA